MTEVEKPPSAIGKAVSLFLALLPPARMAWIVFTYGENNLSNDYIGRVSLVTSMLDGTCTLGRFVRDAWIGGGHSAVALISIYYLNARFFAWDARVELALGLLIAGATLALIAVTLPARARWWLLPLLSLLLFSTAKVSSFTFGESTLQMGLAQLGIAMGAFGFARRGDRPVALAVWVAAGGVLASWAWGGGIMAWPVFFAALVVWRVRKVTAWAVFAGGAAAGVAQYAWLLRPGMSGAVPGPVSWTAKWSLFLDLLGRPLVNGIAHADPNRWSQAIGVGGLLALAAMLIHLRTTLRARPVPLLLVGWTLLVAFQIALFRAAVASWYASPMTFFWVGLLLLLAAAPAALRAGGVLLVALLTLRVQRTWEDKSYYLPSRAPVSASCLREWRTAPAECHARVFQWGEEGHAGELALLGAPLEKHRLSVFGPRRTYLLQGDVSLGRVRLETGGALSFLSADGRTRADPNGVRRLGLAVASGGAVSWRVDLPPGTRTARFRSVIRTDPDESSNARGATVSASAGVDGPTVASRVFLGRGQERELMLDLSSLAGRTVRLSLDAEETQTPQAQGAPLIWKAPRIELALEETK
ncbi:MAG: hypothetical protein ACHQM4_00280 [Thermoanaerobaculia bacterium]